MKRLRETRALSLFSHPLQIPAQVLLESPHRETAHEQVLRPRDPLAPRRLRAGQGRPTRAAPDGLPRRRRRHRRVSRTGNFRHKDNFSTSQFCMIGSETLLCPLLCVFAQLVHLVENSAVLGRLEVLSCDPAIGDGLEELGALIRRRNW